MASAFARPTPFNDCDIVVASAVLISTGAAKLSNGSSNTAIGKIFLSSLIFRSL
jgi:hypothetical protein